MDTFKPGSWAHYRGNPTAPLLVAEGPYEDGTYLVVAYKTQSGRPDLVFVSSEHVTS